MGSVSVLHLAFWWHYLSTLWMKQNAFQCEISSILAKFSFRKVSKHSHFCENCRENHQVLSVFAKIIAKISQIFAKTANFFIMPRAFAPVLRMFTGKPIFSRKSVKNSCLQFIFTKMIPFVSYPDKFLRL